MKVAKLKEEVSTIDVIHEQRKKYFKRSNIVFVLNYLGTTMFVTKYLYLSLIQYEFDRSPVICPCICPTLKNANMNHDVFFNEK